MKKYIYFVPMEKREEIDELANDIITGIFEDAETKGQFKAKVMISNSPKEGYDELELHSFRAGIFPGVRYVKILEKEEEEEGVTVFVSKRAGERRGHMLRSLITEEEKKAIKEKTMKEELEARRKWREEITKKILDKRT